ncbi:MAG TPA: hypothetical protein VKO18_00725 [Terriglobia bacterium]|nr:hypothetical protein [Terriglobia bacterium]
MKRCLDGSGAPLRSAFAGIPKQAVARKVIVGVALAMALALLLPSASRADNNFFSDLRSDVPRYPKGIYAAVESYGANSSGVISVSTNLQATLNDVLTNPAVSGITVQGLLWFELNPNAPAPGYRPPPLDCSHLPTYDPQSSDPYNWTATDTTFCAAESWNKNNPSSPPKTIVLAISPGFYTPKFVLDQINEETCSGEFQFQTPFYLLLLPDSATSFNTPSVLPPTATCDLAYFPNNEGLAVGTGYTRWSPLPMPWDPTYKRAWETFLRAVDARYGRNPAFVAIDIAGPTSFSDEILFPSGPSSINEWKIILANQFPPTSTYQSSDQVFIDEFHQAIKMYERIFSDITLIVVTASGPPNLGNPSITDPYCAEATDDTMACLAVESIVADFLETSGRGGRNARAIEQAGLHSTPELFLGAPFTKAITQTTAQSIRVLGGQEFFGGLPWSTPATWSQSELQAFQLWCPNVPDTLPPGASPQPPCTAEQALYNTLSEFFYGTAAAPTFPNYYTDYYTNLDISTYPVLAGQILSGPAPLNFLQIYSQDIITINTLTTSVPVISGECTANEYTSGMCTSSTFPGSTSTAQELLNMASEWLDKISEQPRPLRPHEWRKH